MGTATKSCFHAETSPPMPAPFGHTRSHAFQSRGQLAAISAGKQYRAIAVAVEVVETSSHGFEARISGRKVEALLSLNLLGKH